MKVCSVVAYMPDTLDQCTEQIHLRGTMRNTGENTMKAALIAYLRKCVAATHLTHLLRETLSNAKINNT